MDKIELIDRAAVRALAYVSTDWSHGAHPLVVELSDIDDLPAIDAFHVVRCKDCILRTYEECPMFHYEERLLPWGVEYVPVDRTTDDGFCHMGRRADDETD